MAHAAPGVVLFPSDGDRKVYIGLLQRAVEAHELSIRTFTLMSNHVHVVVAGRPDALTHGIGEVQSRYANRHKFRYESPRGPVFDSRFKSKPVTTEAYQHALVRYVGLNAVEAGVVARPELYPWCADRALRGVAPPNPVIDLDAALEPFGGSPRQYAAFVDGEDPPLYDLVCREGGQARRDRPALEEIVVPGDASTLVAAFERWGYSVAEIASATGVHRTTIHRRLTRAGSR